MWVTTFFATALELPAMNITYHKSLTRRQLLHSGSTSYSGPPTSSGSSSTACDACGASATYSEVIANSGGYSKRTITTSGCPNHYSYCTGKEAIANCGGSTADNKEGSITEATDQGRTLEIPASPVIAASVTDIECQTGTVALALNGVSLFSGAVDNQCSILDVDSNTAEWTSFDYCGGHAEQTGN